MDQINEATRVRMKIVQPHPGPIEDNSQQNSELISISCSIGTDKFTLSDSISNSPDKQSKYQQKQESLGQQGIASKTKLWGNSTVNSTQTTSKLSQKKAKSFMIPQNDDDRIYEQDTPMIRIRSQSNVNENDQPRESQQEKQIDQQEYENNLQKYKQKMRQQTGPSFGAQSDFITPSSSLLPSQQLNSVNYYAPYHQQQGSITSTFSFQQLLLPQQLLKKNESLITNSPQTRLAQNEELSSDRIKQSGDQDIYGGHFPTFKQSSEGSNINNTQIQKDQSIIFHPITQSNITQPNRFQMSLYQTENMIFNSDDQSQIMTTDIYNNSHKSSGEVNADDTYNRLTNNLTINQLHNTDHSITTFNILQETETRELCASKRKLKKRSHSHLRVNNGDLAEEDEEDNENSDNDDKFNQNQIQTVEKSNDGKKKSQSISGSIISGLKSLVKSPLGKDIRSPMNFFSNKGTPSKRSEKQIESRGFKSEICSNAVSQQKDDQSNLELISNVNDQLSQKDVNDKIRNSKLIAMNVIQTLQKARQKHIDRAKARQQEKVMVTVKQFLDILKIRSKLKSPFLIKKKILEIINDLVYPNKQNYRMSTSKNASLRFSRAFMKLQIPTQSWINYIYNKINIPIFHPQSQFKLAWDFMHILIILLIFFYIPIQMVTGQNMGMLIQAEDAWRDVILIIFFFFIIDILISFNTGIYDQGIVNENRKDVSLTYIKGQMILDIIFTVSIMKTYYDMNSGSILSIIFCFMFILKLFTLSRILNNFTDIILSIKNNTKLYYFIELISLLITILFVGHVNFPTQLFTRTNILYFHQIKKIFACAFWNVSEQNQTDSKTWMKKAQVQYSNWQTKYLYSIYFSVTTMITVGYGDITPQNNSEIILGIVCMILSSAVFGYSLNTIGVIIKEIQKDGHYIKEQMSLVNRYLNGKNINRDLKVKVRMFLQYKLKTKNIISLEQEKYILDELSTQLREKLITEENINIMKQCKSTFSSFSVECLQKLAPRMKQIRVSKNEMIFEEGQYDEDPLFYFIQRGSLELFVESVKGDYNFTTLAILTEGYSLGEISIYLDQIKTTVSAKAIEMSILKTLSRSDILDVLRFFPKDYEKFSFFKDEILFNQQTDKIHKSCYNCSSLNHTINFCPYLHYVPDKEQIILRHIFPHNQIRSNSIDRSLARKINAVRYLRTIQDRWKIFVEKQKEENMLVTWGSEEDENQNYFTSDQDESQMNQTNRISNTTTQTYKQGYQYNNNNNMSSLSNQKSSYQNLFNRSKNINKSGFHPEKTNQNVFNVDNSRRSRNESQSSIEGSPQSSSSNDSYLSHSFVVLGNNKKMQNYQTYNGQQIYQSNQLQIPHQSSSINSQNVFSPQKSTGLFRQAETIDNPMIKEEEYNEDNNHKEQDEQIGEFPQNYSIQNKRYDAYQKNPQMVSTISGTGSGGNDTHNNILGYTNPAPLGNRRRQSSQTNTNRSILSIQKPPPPSSVNTQRSSVKNLSMKINNNNNQQTNPNNQQSHQNNILNNEQYSNNYVSPHKNQQQNNNSNNNINIIDQHYQHHSHPITSGVNNLLEVPRNNSLRKDSTENIRLNTSINNRSKGGENEHISGKTNQNLLHQSGNLYPTNNNGFTFNQNNSYHQNNNTVVFNKQDGGLQNKQQKIYFDRTFDIPFYNTNEITEESSSMSKCSTNKVQRVNSNRPSQKNGLKTLNSVQQVQQHPHNYINKQNINEENEQINNNLKQIIQLLQERTPNRNNTPIEGISKFISNSPIPRQTSFSQSQSNQSLSLSKKNLTFSQLFHNYMNQQPQNLPNIGTLQNQLSQISQIQQKELLAPEQPYTLNYIQPQQYMKRRGPLFTDEVLLNYILQQHEANNHQQQINIPLKRFNSGITKEFKALNSFMNQHHNSGNIACNNTPINHKQHQKYMVMQRHQDIQFSQKLAKLQSLKSILNKSKDQDKKGATIDDIIQKEVLQDQAKEFTFYYPEHNVSKIVQDLKTFKITLCSNLSKYTLYKYKNYQIQPYKNMNNQVQLEQTKQNNADQQILSDKQ